MKETKSRPGKVRYTYRHGTFRWVMPPGFATARIHGVLPQKEWMARWMKAEREATATQSVAASDWVQEENARASAVLKPMGALLGVGRMEQIETAMNEECESECWDWDDDALYECCSKTCLVYAGGLMMRWVQMAPTTAMQAHDGAVFAVPSRELGSETISHVECVRRWKLMRGMTSAQIERVFVMCLGVALKMINSPVFAFRTVHTANILARLGKRMPVKKVIEMELRFLQHLHWRTHLRSRPHRATREAALCPLPATYEYNLLLLVMPGLVDGADVNWGALCNATAMLAGA